MNRKRLISILLAGTSFLAAAAAYQVLKPPYTVLESGPYVPVGLSQAHLGTGAGVPSGMGIKNYAWHDSTNPSILFLEGPPPAVRPAQVGLEEDPEKAVKVYASVGGSWSQVDLTGGFSNSGQIAAELPRQYPPGAEPVVRVVSPQGETRLRLRSVASTQALFDLDEEVTEAEAFGGRIRAAAYRPQTEETAPLPSIGVAVQFDVPFEAGSAWRVDEFAVARPFGEPSAKPSITGTSGFELIDNAPRMQEISEAFCDSYPAVKVTGRLIRQKVEEEWLDFGTVPVQEINRRNYVTPSSSMARTTRWGQKIVLHPVSIAKAPPGVRVSPEPQMLHLSLDADGASGKGLAFRVEEMKYHSEAGPRMNGQANLSLTLKRTPAAKYPLRILVRRFMGQETQWFNFLLKVRPVPFAAYGPTSRPGEVYFEPKPQHFALFK